MVLNDNEMSIQPNVGALQLYLNRIRLDPTLTRLREEMERGVSRIPVIGAEAYRRGKDVKESMKALFVPGMLFEELGFAYIGVVDGHDMHALRASIRQAIETRRPVVVHVKTVKGKGYEPAEAYPEAFHGTGPFELGNGIKRSAAAGTTFTEAFGEALVRLAEADERVVAITAAMTEGTGLQEFARRFPDRFYDVGIAEEHAAVFAAGLAIGGLRPVRRRLLHLPAARLRHARAGRRAAAPAGGVRRGPRRPRRRRRPDAPRRLRPVVPAHRSPTSSSWRRRASTSCSACWRTALTLDGPSAIRYPRGLAAPFEAPETLEPLAVGEAAVLAGGRWHGADRRRHRCGHRPRGGGAAGGAGRGADARRRTLREAARHGAPGPALRRAQRLVTVEENVLPGGFGSAVLEHVAGSGVEVVRCGLPDGFVPHGDRDRLLRDVGLTAAAVAAAAGATRPAALTRVK